MDRVEARAVAQAELHEACSESYEQLKANAPRLAPESEQPPRWLRRWVKRWDPTPESRRHRWIRGDSGTLYQVVREINWDDEIGGVLRIWALVDNVDSAAEPEVVDDLVYPPSRL